MALLPPKFLNNVVAIGEKKTEEQLAKEREAERQICGDPQCIDEFCWSGTGFLIGYLRGKVEAGPQYGAYLVTNRHVLKKHDKVAIRQRFSDGRDQTYILALTENDEPSWQAPEGIDVAVATLPLDRLREGLGVQVDSLFRSDIDVLTREKMRDAGLTEGDGVFVLGYPMGLLVKGRRDVVARQGCIARIQTMYDTKTAEYWLDSPIFPGNSGGPVLTKPEAAAVGGTTGFRHCRLIGIVQSYLPYRDVAISQQTHRPRIIFEENSGLASVISMDTVMGVIKSMEEKPQ